MSRSKALSARLLLAALAMVPAACSGDETISGYADPAAIYVLAEIDGTAFAPRATILFSEAGRAAGEAPCNLWSADQTAPYPWFSLGPVASTRRACPDLAAEGTFFAALSEMTLAEVHGPVLILSNEAGREMVFRIPQD